LARRALFSKHFKLVFITLALIFVLLIILAFIADFTGKTSANLWQFAALVGGWIGGMLSAIGIIPTRLTRQHNERNVARCLSTSRLRRWGNLTRQCEKEKGGLALSEGMGCTLTN